jgi:two-component system, chemotaxis family, protein-glutamate methylesterase/glutaminase
MTYMDNRDLVVVGASAGGVEALRALVAGLPEDFPACVVVVLHVPATAPSALPSILARAGRLPVRQAADQDPLEPGTVLVAPPDHHVIVYDDAVTLSRGPRENGHRPAVDVLFRSAARTRGDRVVGVVLSGGLDDGAAGMLAIAQRGGACVVQAFDDALHASMPRAAAAAVPDCTTAPMATMGRVLAELVGQTVPDSEPPPARMEMEMRMADLDAAAMHAEHRPGTPSGFACPDCHGALFELEGEPMLRFRCRVGHAWSAGSLVAQQTADVESALWMALRNLEEKAALNRDLGGRAMTQGHDLAARHFADRAAEAVHAAELLRSLIERIGDQVEQVDRPDASA